MGQVLHKVIVRRALLTHAVAVGIVSAPTAVLQSQQDSTPVRIDSVVVTVTRTTGRSILGSPFAVTIAQPDSARPGQRHTAVDETLALIPGLSATNRNNPSQDPRISIRGFGARSAFGVRGIRVLRDGMPLTLPDGQTPLDYLSLESVGRVEVMRGAASALYGNASGGVIDIRSVHPSPSPISVDARQWIGSNESLRSAVAASGSSGSAYYVADVARTSSDGDRPHSRQRATTGFLHVGGSAGDTQFSLTGLALDNPLAENPGALTLEEMRANSAMADALSLRRNARKAVRQLQIGLSAIHLFGAGDASVSVFGGSRSLDNPLTFAVVEVGRHTYGASTALHQVLNFLGAQHRAVAGVDLQSQNDLRRNYTTCADTIPATIPTVTCPYPPSERGSVALDQRELVTSAGAYASDAVSLGRYVELSLGIRADRIRFKVEDRLFGGSNPDDSGERTLGAVSPIAGILARLTPAHSAYANFSAAFETPTATELGNHADGSAGINPDLDPQRSRTFEVGAKGYFGKAIRYDAAMYQTRVLDELVPFEIPNSNGRRFFRNAGRTTRCGAEIGGEVSKGPASLLLAYNYSHFRFNTYTVGTANYSGKEIPGVPSHRVQSALRMSRERWFAVLEEEIASETHADDANLTRARGYSVSHIRAGLIPVAGRRRLSITLGAQNIFNRAYAASLAVNAARGKYYEPAARRTLFVGLAVGGQTGK